MPTEQCANCQHWQRSDPKQLALAARTLAPDVGECHRFPPRETGRHVRTESVHACGEWTPRAEAPVQGELAGVDGAKPRKRGARQ